MAHTALPAYFILRTLFLAPAILSLLVVAGCGPGTAHLSGNVTYDGQPVMHGWISFLPTDNEGPAIGGPITDGKYDVEKIQPGRKLIKIEAVKKVPFARSDAEMKKMAEAAKQRGNGSGLIDKADIIPPDAIGNNETVDVTPGKHTLDLPITHPRKH